MKLELSLERAIDKKLVAQNKERERPPSGKLSASKLSLPTQWAVLHSLGVSDKEFDAYVLRKFARGNDVEDWFISQIETEDTQVLESYKGAIGYADALVDTKSWDFPVGVVPLEVKSVTNAKFKRIKTTKEPQYGHAVQGAFYALGQGVDDFALTYIASDDYRTLTWVFGVAEYKEFIDHQIQQFQDAKEQGIIPVFESIEDWNANPKYASYLEWQELSSEDALKKLEAEYPECYKKLIK